MEYICIDCPRKCNVKKQPDKPSGVCGSSSVPVIARAALHFGEEPCISGTRGSGAVFFSGCSLKCVFCQNTEISQSIKGKPVDKRHFAEILMRLQDEGAHNINLVTASHHTRFVAEVLSRVKPDIPVIWNSSGYESVESLRMLEGLIDVYLPDYKYSSAALAEKYSSAPDYPSAAAEAIKEMFRQTGSFTLDENGIVKKGVIIRHLLLPGQAENCMNAIDFAADEFPEGSICFSLMSQFVPCGKAFDYPELCRPVSRDEYENMKHYLLNSRIIHGYWQEPDSATRDFIPAFDGTGV